MDNLSSYFISTTKPTIMENLKINAAFEKAEDLLRVAQDELFRPEEDVVPFLVYQKAKLATSEFLVSFLTHHGLEVFSIDPEILLNQCCEINRRFYDLNITALTKVGKEEDSWVSIRSAREFVKIAENTRSLILREMV